MSDYQFFAQILRFVSRKTERADARIAQMMDALDQAASEVESFGRITVKADALESTARAFAGVAAFLQKQILPEAVAEGNALGEKQIRWAIDNSMAAVNRLLTLAAEDKREDTVFTFEAAP